MGEQRNPGDSTSFLVPQVDSPVGGWPIGSIGDYFGLPTVGQVSAGKSVTHSALPFRAYNLILMSGFVMKIWCRRFGCILMMALILVQVILF